MIYRFVTLSLLSNRLADGRLHGQAGADQLAPISGLFCGSVSGSDRAMSVAPSPADFDQAAGALLEYDELETAWPKCRHVLVQMPSRRHAFSA